MIWEAAASHFDGDGFFFGLIDYSWSFVHPSYTGALEGAEPGLALADQFAILDRTRAAGDRLASAAIGETVEVPLELDELERHLSDFESRMQQEPFPQLPLEDQKYILLCIDAARKLRQASITAG